MAERKIYVDAKKFALTVIRICRTLQSEKREFILTNQLLRSATSIGANISESKYAQSNADFVSKLQIALKESAESEYWLELLEGGGYLTEEESKSLKAECGRLRKMLSSAVMTAKQFPSSCEALK